MATQTEIPAVTPPAQIVGNAFVEQYYHILHQSPELVFRFYQDSSVLSRPDSNGVITSATTMQGINEKILSLNYKDFIAEIKTADAQQSLGDGVVVLVTGYLTGSDSVRKKFGQTFFLAPQEKGFYVLNDIFRYVEDEDKKAEPVLSPVDCNTENVQAAFQTRELEQPSHVVNVSEQVHELSNEEDLSNEPEVCDPSDIEDGSIPEEEVVDPPLPHLDQSENVTIASVIRPSINQEVSGFLKPAPVSEALSSNNEAVPEKNDVTEEAEGYSIYVRNLPQSATAEQVEEVFTKFGPIKQGGVQVRSNKQGFCFGFVEYESLSSVKSAIEASPLLIGNRKTVIEEKRTSARGAANPNNGRGRYPSSRGGFRSESFRGRGNFGGGRGYGRSDFRGSGEFSGRPRGSAGRGSEGYQRVDQNGTANGTRPTAQN
ncbi:hypothetical protein KSS87_011544 [Heliosperma pusillum]|nr:hypothetical protein KSS87_011544 [Heliosperma pusillum]